MDLSKFNRHYVDIELVDGDILSGYVDAYISALDNDPEPESIIVISNGILYEIAEDEITSIVTKE